METLALPRYSAAVLAASLVASLAASLALAGCSASSPAMTSDLTPAAAPAPAAAQTAAAPAGAGLSVSERELTPDEKKLIMNAISTALKNPAAAKYHWAKFPTVPESDQPAYCSTVDGQSPFAAYSGRQAYIVDTKLSGGHITAATLGEMAGGSDFKLIVDKCAEHGLDPRKAS